MYRTDALAQIDVTGAGLVIEDFNMTFEIHAKKLGRIEFHPSAAVAYTQDPDTSRRVRPAGAPLDPRLLADRPAASFPPGVFWVALAVFIVELITSSLMFVLLIPVLVASMLAAAAAVHRPRPGELDVLAGRSAARRRTSSSAC